MNAALSPIKEIMNMIEGRDIKRERERGQVQHIAICRYNNNYINKDFMLPSLQELYNLPIGRKGRNVGGSTMFIANSV